MSKLETAKKLVRQTIEQNQSSENLQAQSKNQFHFLLTQLNEIIQITHSLNKSQDVMGTSLHQISQQQQQELETIKQSIRLLIKSQRMTRTILLLFYLTLLMPLLALVSCLGIFRLLGI